MEKKPFGLKFSEFIVKKRWIFVGIFIALLIFSCIMLFRTEVIYDLSQYLPKNSDTNSAMTILKEEFDDKGMTYVMVKGVAPSDASAQEANDKIVEIQNAISKIKGIASVVYDPTTGYKDGNVMYTVMLTDYDSTDGAFDTVERLLAYLDGLENDTYITGQSAFSYYTKQETFDSIYTIGVVIVVAVLLMLLFTSKTYFELLIMIVVFAAAVLINMGTNFIFNGISYVANLIALVLQLALSIDYSVILLHRFMEEKETEPDAAKAAVNALRKGVPEILSSSLTTIAGLGSLMLMTLPIGVEIGLSLAKSIVFSLLAVIFLMPALLVIFKKPLSKKHRNFVPNITRPARAIVRARKVIVPLFLIISVLAAVGQSFNTYSFNMNGGSFIVTGREEFAENFSTMNTLVVIVPKGDYEKERDLAEYVTSYELIDSVTALSVIDISSFAETTEGESPAPVYLTDSVAIGDMTDIISTMMPDAAGQADLITSILGPEFEKAYRSLNGLASDDAVSATATLPIIDFLEFAYRDQEFMAVMGPMAQEVGVDMEGMLGTLVSSRTQLQSENYSRLMFNINGDIESDETFKLITDVKNGLGDFYSEHYINGESVVCYEMAQFFPRDNLIVSVLIVVFMLVILFATFKNLVLPIILVLAIQGSIWINFAVPFLGSTAVSFIGYLIISAVQMGATIDYAIVLTNRYATIKKDYANRLDAMAAAENAVFPTIVTSGVILIITGFTLGLAASGVVASMGMLMGIGACMSVFTVIFVLPSLLLVTEKLVDKTNFHIPKRLKRKKVDPITVDQPNDAESISEEIPAQ